MGEQAEYAVRTEWGPVGADAVAEGCDHAVVVDVAAGLDHSRAVPVLRDGVFTPRWAGTLVIPPKEPSCRAPTSCAGSRPPTWPGGSAAAR